MVLTFQSNARAKVLPQTQPVSLPGDQPTRRSRGRGRSERFDSAERFSVVAQTRQPNGQRAGREGRSQTSRCQQLFLGQARIRRR